MRRLTELFVVALLAVGLAIGYQFAVASFTTIGPPVTNNYTKALFQEVRGVDLTVAELTETAVAGSYLTVTGLAVDDVIFSVVSFGASTTAEAPIDCTVDFTIAATATKVRIAGTTTGFSKNDDFLIGYYDVSNTN